MTVPCTHSFVISENCLTTEKMLKKERKRERPDLSHNLSNATTQQPKKKSKFKLQSDPYISRQYTDQIMGQP